MLPGNADSHKDGSDYGYLAFENPILQDKKQKGQVLSIEFPVALNSGLLNYELGEHSVTYTRHLALS